MADAENNMKFCRKLTGVVEIPVRLVDSIMTRAEKKFGSQQLGNVLATFKQHVIDEVMRTNELANIAREITYCLYTGMFLKQGDRIEPVEDYFESLIWRVIQAHPPGLSGGYFGHWHYAPEDNDVTE